MPHFIILAMSFEVDSESLIDLIDERSCLWDLTGDTYKDKPKRAKAWIEVGEQLVEHSNWYTLLVCTYQRLFDDRRE